MNAAKYASDQLTRKDLEKEARKHGGWIESDTVENDIVLQCVAPVNHVWVCDDLHLLVCTWVKGDSAWRSDSIRDAIDRMSEGVRYCGCDNCLKSEEADRIGSDQEGGEGGGA